MSITQPEWIPKATNMALGIQHAMRMRHIVKSGPPGSKIFFLIIS